MNSHVTLVASTLQTLFYQLLLHHPSIRMYRSQGNNNWTHQFNRELRSAFLAKTLMKILTSFSLRCMTKDERTGKMSYTDILVGKRLKLAIIT